MAYVIVGASASGINAARTLRENDKNAEIILVSKDELLIVANSPPLLFA